MSHVIRSGDTLGEIAQRYNVTVSQILAVNPRIRNAHRVRVGQVIRIPSRRSRGSSSRTRTRSRSPRSARSSRSPRPVTAVETNSVEETSAVAETSAVEETSPQPEAQKIEVSNVYTIKRGDSLDKIARKYNMSLGKLLKANPSIKNANRIRIGQKIIIPSDTLLTQVKNFFTFRWMFESENTYVEVNPYETASKPENNPEEVDVDKDGALVDENTHVEEFNRRKFFTTYRRVFGSLNQGQVNGLNSLLHSFEEDEHINKIQHIAYMLATIKHETANRFQPITEYGGRSYFSRYDPVLANSSRRRARAKANGNTRRGDGYKYRGRGFVQITWQKNYKKLGAVLGHDLVKYPEKALDPVIAYQIMSYGMRYGIFTGRRLSHYLTDTHTDYRLARKIINGMDKATRIKHYAENFEKVLRVAIA
ncbi:MAG: LysM peptidoglycan-binding domain-containing protein [Methylococcales bacterium]|nr:LysM peptidoglycan-binding domain-containing protein [Methylococcales bacterium]